MLETSLPPDFINLLNTEIDSLLAEENVKDKDFSGNLVGQIKNGAQLALEKDRCDAFHGVYGVAESLAKEYAKRFMMIGGVTRCSKVLSIMYMRIATRRGQSIAFGGITIPSMTTAIDSTVP